METRADNSTFTQEFPFELRSVEGSDGLTLEGYAAVFDSPTPIDSYDGRFTEIVARGAFTKTISERTPVLMFDHGKHPLIGGLPIGTISTIKEDSHGLFVRARLADNWLVQPVRDAIRDGAVTGMSFRFGVKKDSWTRAAANGDPRIRTLLEVACPELGPVVFPAYDDTTVSVRSRELARSLATDEKSRTDLALALLIAPVGGSSPAPPAPASTDSRAVPDDTSFGDVKCAVCDALCDKLGLEDYMVWVVDLSDTWAIYMLGDDYHKIAYTMDDAGLVTFTGDPVDVEQVTTWVADTDDATEMNSATPPNAAGTATATPGAGTATTGEPGPAATPPSTPTRHAALVAIAKLKEIAA